ncbi:MAG: NAD(P)H-hydrate epimerase [Candidatus Scalindua sp.]|nr:NAD(P)H-hydrate epimerase [Candidatus Scalindua sp.]
MDSANMALGRDEVREIDRKAMEEYEIPGIILMENAGKNAAEEILKMLPGTDSARVAVFCGKGNNGGDGFVIARHLHNKGVDVSVYLTTEVSRVLSDGDSSTNLKILLNMNLEINELHEGHIEKIGEVLHDYNVIVDAIFGTGLRGEVREPVRTLIAKINEADVPVVSIDIPSGLDCDDGVVLGTAVKATKTVTFVAAKTGFFEECGKEYTGELIVSDISVPRELIEKYNKTP